MDLSGLRVGQPVHGAVGEVTASGFIVDFQRYRGFLPRCELRADERLGQWDEVEAWIVELDPLIGWVRLASQPMQPALSPTDQAWTGIRPDLTPPGRPQVRMGEGVPFHELYMTRRTKRSWSRG